MPGDNSPPPPSAVRGANSPPAPLMTVTDILAVMRMCVLCMMVINFHNVLSQDMPGDNSPPPPSAVRGANSPPAPLMTVTDILAVMRMCMLCMMVINFHNVL